MAKKWVEVAASPAYQALAPEQQEEARNQYWSEVVAPNVPQQEQATVRQAFDADTQRTVNWPDAGAMEIPITGGTLEPASVGQSGVTREQRQQRLAAADEALDLDARRSSLDTQEGIGRNLALGGRAMLRGVVGLPDMVVAPLVAGVNRLLPEQYQQTGLTGMVDVLADKVGAPRPANAAERVSSDVTSAIAGGGVGLGVGNALARLGGRGVQSGGGNMLTSLGNTLQAQPLQQLMAAGAGSAAGSITRENGGGAGAQLAASLAGGVGPNALATLGAASARGLVRGTSGAQMQRTIADFNALGANPSVAQASGNRMLQGAENLLAGGPTSAGVMARFTERQADDIGAGLRKVGENLSPSASAERAGRAIERGADTSQQNIGAMRQALYWQADRFIPQTTATPMANTVNTLASMTQPTAGAVATTSGMINPWLQGLRRDLAADLQAGNGQIPYEALRRIRTEVGERMNDFSMTPDTPARQLKGLYAALSRDMEAVAASQGPDAVRAARRANTYTRVSSERLEAVQRIIDKNGGPERVYSAAMSGTNDGATTLRAVMQALPRDGQKAVTAAVVKRMGLATPGAQDDAGQVFSAATFLTKWNQLSQEARRALFDRYGAGFSESMDQVARVANNLKQGAKVYANPSGTANRTAAMSYGVGLVGSILQLPFTGNMVLPAGAVAGGAFANAAARLLTNPRVVSALARTTTLPKGAILGQVQSMRQIADRDSDPVLAEAADALERANNEASNAEQQEARQ
ncbi:hypothetical protein FHY35_004048 [Xanthomonas arboricola]|uniref:hypothetical protein n=1 Tax=Xanthomonas arboricola TaxID=56448 RepID=UPI00141A9804|nr:hypothetical protein [Xanthomonas arboricola]NIJ86998.1 hypothetical protein [Xanthomonas arboricola]